MNQNDKYGESPRLRSPVIEKLENFWYHYKWHTLIALFLVFAILVCSLQMCSKEDFDVYIMYAGNESISRTSKDGSITEYASCLMSLKRVARDYDGNGEIGISLSTLFVLSDAEIEEIKKNDPDKEINYNLLSPDRESLHDRMLYSEYYICFISKYVYEEYRVTSGVEIFAPLSPYLPEGDSSFVFENEDAIYLSSTDLYLLPGICELPEDTLICLRKRSEVASVFDKQSKAHHYERSVEVLKNILALRIDS